MSIKICFVRFSLTKDQLSELFLLLGTVETKTTDEQAITLNGAVDHQKMGLPGIEDKSNHFFTTFLLVDGKYRRARVSLISEDGGHTYTGGAEYKIESS